jgi:hypothetical protein
MFVYVVCNDLSARLLDLDRFYLSATDQSRKVKEGLTRFDDLL